MLNKRILAYVPLFFWLLIIGIKLIRILPLTAGEELVSRIETILITTPLEIINFCLFYFLIIPNVMAKKRLYLNLAVSVVFLLSYGVVWSWVYELTGRISGFDQQLMIYKASLGHTLLATLYAIVLRLSVDWFRSYQRQQEIEKQHIKTELALLRAQINPHFLFNTLNNINAFSSRDPEKTSFAIIKLSEIMRYMLYEAVSDKVLLDNEIAYINNFIALQKLRYKENHFLHFAIEGETANIFIPPMIFLPFIENAFKHGSLTAGNGIDVMIRVHDKEISFRCSNQKRKQTETEEDKIGGLGIKNIKRRLALLFPDEHQLSITNENNEYIVSLSIQLNGH